MKTYSRTLVASTQKPTWSSGGVSNVELPRDYVLQSIIMDTRGTVDLASAVLVEDAGQKLFKQIKFQLVGGITKNKTVVDLGGVDLYFVNFYDNGEGLERVIPSANGTGSAVSLQMIIDFRLAKNDPDDFSVGIALYDKTSATLSIVWDTIANGYGSGVSNLALTTNVTLLEGIPENEKEYEAAKKAPLLTLTSKEVSCDSTSGKEENRNDDIPTGILMRRMWLMPKTSAGARSDTELDYITFKKINDPYFETLDWDALCAQDERDYNLSNYDGNRAIKGLACLDYAHGAVDEKGRVLGENWGGLKSGDLKLTIYKNNASTKLRYIMEAVEAVA